MAYKDVTSEKQRTDTRSIMRSAVLLPALLPFVCLFCLALSRPSYAAKKYPTTYKGVNYARVYNFDYYMKHYPSVKKKVKNNPKKALRYFVRTGMKRGHRACSSFDVKSYYRGNPKLRKKFGKKYKKYYLYYINGGYKEKNAKKTATGVKNIIYADTLSSSSIKISSCKISGKYVVIKATVSGIEKGRPIQLYAVPSYVTKLSKQTSRKTVNVSGKSLSVKLPLNLGTKDSVLQMKFLFGAASGKTKKIISNAFYIQNPQAAAANKTAVPKPARGTKKGLKIRITSDEYLKKISELKCSHISVDFPLEAFLGGSGLSYEYNGRTYHFSSAILSYQNYLKQVRKKGVVITGVFYLSDKKLTKYMLPAAAKADKSQSTTFELNTANSTRYELEALFSCLADYFCTDGALVSNWIFGNEIDQYRRYNFSGNISYAKYIKYYADAFRMFNTAVKSRYKNARTYFSFDHNWNLSFTLDGSYRGKQVLHDINAYLKKQGAIHWDIALNPYPSPELDPRFWNLSPLVTKSADSQQFTMMTMRYLSAWIKKTYGKNVHIILPEVGISSYYQGKEMQAEQAAAVAYAYYLAEFDPNIDLFIIQREMSDPVEEARGFHVSLYKSSFSKPKKSVDVFKYMDTPSWSKHTKSYIKYIKKDSSWAKLVPGFTPSRFS